MELVLKSFDQLSVKTFHDLIKLRIDIFVVEQNCPYPELDGKDETALHLIMKEGEKIVGCLRILPKTEKQAITIGRVAVHEAYRNRGIAKTLMNKAITYIEEELKEDTIYLMAQTYLKEFYQSCGFKVVSEEYLEDNIPHIDMIRKQKC
ncbi:MAG: GNAT family N-acetyltransferase [Bacillaceae bacterium]